MAEITSELLPASAEWRALVTRQGEDDELVIEVEATRELCHEVERAFRDRIGLSLSVRALPAGSMARSLEKTQRVLIDSPGGGASVSNRRG